MTTSASTPGWHSSTPRRAGLYSARLLRLAPIGVVLCRILIGASTRLIAVGV